jgi:hypothetical protein
MTIKRLDHVSVVVEDLADAVAFFTALGITKEGEAAVEGESSRWPRNSAEAFNAFRGNRWPSFALLRLDTMARNHSAFSPTCAAVLKVIS